MLSYFHRAGRKVPVHISTCAFVVPRAPECISPDPHWRIVPFAHRFTLLVDAANDTLSAPAPDGAGRRTLLSRVARLARDPTIDRGDVPVLRPAADATPVLVPPDRPLVLCPTGAVVARAGRGGVAGMVATVRARGWRVERSVRFLTEAFVLRRALLDAAEPLELANALVEQVGCRFAHPVMFEEVVTAA